MKARGVDEEWHSCSFRNATTEAHGELMKLDRDPGSLMGLWACCILEFTPTTFAAADGRAVPLSVPFNLGQSQTHSRPLLG